MGFLHVFMYASRALPLPPRVRRVPHATIPTNHIVPSWFASTSRTAKTDATASHLTHAGDHGPLAGLISANTGLYKRICGQNVSEGLCHCAHFSLSELTLPRFVISFRDNHVFSDDAANVKINLNLNSNKGRVQWTAKVQLLMLPLSCHIWVEAKVRTRQAK